MLLYYDEVINFNSYNAIQLAKWHNIAVGFRSKKKKKYISELAFWVLITWRERFLWSRNLNLWLRYSICIKKGLIWFIWLNLIWWWLTSMEGVNHICLLIINNQLTHTDEFFMFFFLFTHPFLKKFDDSYRGSPWQFNRVQLNKCKNKIGPFFAYDL